MPEQPKRPKRPFVYDAIAHAEELKALQAKYDAADPSGKSPIRLTVAAPGLLASLGVEGAPVASFRPPRSGSPPEKQGKPKRKLPPSMLQPPQPSWQIPNYIPEMPPHPAAMRDDAPERPPARLGKTRHGHAPPIPGKALGHELARISRGGVGEFEARAKEFGIPLSPDRWAALDAESILFTFCAAIRLGLLPERGRKQSLEAGLVGLLEILAADDLDAMAEMVTVLSRKLRERQRTYRHRTIEDLPYAFMGQLGASMRLGLGPGNPLDGAAIEAAAGIIADLEALQAEG